VPASSIAPQVGHGARPSHGGRASRLAAIAVLLAAWGYADRPAFALPGDLETIAKASDLDKDPLDFEAVTTVCARCHAASQFLSTPRSYRRWEDVFGRMSRYGATGSDDQLNRVIRYFDRNLTVVNVNTSPVEELAPVLQISAATADEIARRRAQKPFANLAGLRAIPGIDQKKLKVLESKGRLQF
jgi:hypothetical protein